MKFIGFIVLMLSQSSFTAELCQDNKSEKSNGHIHYITEGQMKNDLIDYKNLVDLTPLQNQEQTRVKLDLVGFETFPGGIEVSKDIEKARLLLQRILNSTEFKDDVIFHKYRNKYGFKKNNDKSNAEIYQNIKEGSDKFDRTVDFEMDLILCPYYSSKNVIGYTYSSRKEVWVNFKYYRDKYNNFDIGYMIGNILHEWIHNVGFKHASKNNSTRKYTVPYGVGYIARDIARAID